MADSPEEIKERITLRYLGKFGVHGVGLRLRDEAVCLYITPDSPLESSEAIEEIRRLARPLRVILVREEPAFLTSSSITRFSSKGSARN